MPGPDTIVVPAGVYVFDPPFGAIEANPAEATYAGDLDVTGDVTVTGAGAAATIVDAAGIDRAFDIADGVTIAMTGLTIRNGNAGGDRGNPPSLLGGGILNEGTLTFSDGVIADCVAVGGGGGIANFGTLTILRSTIRGNATVGRMPLFLLGGGGIESVGATLSITDSLIADNLSTTIGGGINAFNSSGVAGPVSLTNVTMTGNRAEQLAGGGTFGNTVTTFSNVTITANASGGNVGGVSLTGLAATLGNSIVAGNTAAGSVPDCTGIALSFGHNLIGDATACMIGGVFVGNLSGVSPILGPLQQNGGPTLTRALRSASPARDAGSPLLPGSGGGACAAADQRGIPRPVGLACDMGAVESSCGDGTQQGFELCDDGNTTDGDGCDSNCTPTACGNGIVTGGEQCDEGAGDADCCTAGCALVDADGDGACDRVDPCTGVTVLAPRLTIALGQPASGDEQIAFAGSVTLPLPLEPRLDPLRRGMRVVLSGANGTILDEIVAPGDGQVQAYGWKTSGFVFVPGPPPNLVGHRFIYGDRRVDPILPSGINSVKIRRTPNLSDRFLFKVRGKAGAIPVTSDDLPLAVALVLDVPTAATGQCAEVAFAAGDCAVSRNGKRMICH
jgi:cysteine-rich repeat protein